jgi:hypothetical protein
MKTLLMILVRNFQILITNIGIKIKTFFILEFMNKMVNLLGIFLDIIDMVFIDFLAIDLFKINRCFTLHTFSNNKSHT